MTNLGNGELRGVSFAMIRRGLRRPCGSRPAPILHAIRLNGVALCSLRASSRRRCGRRRGSSDRRSGVSRIVRHHADTGAFAMQFAQQFHHGLAVARIEVSCGFVRQQDAGGPARRGPQQRAAADRPRAVKDSASYDGPCRLSRAIPARAFCAQETACRDRSAAVRHSRRR